MNKKSHNSFNGYSGTCASDDTHLCDSNAMCSDASCVCNTGFSGDGLTCVGNNNSNKDIQIIKLFSDTDECSENRGNCNSSSLCHNTAGSHECSPCPTGYTPNANFSACQGTNYHTVVT